MLHFSSFQLAKRLFSDPDLALVRPGGYLRPRRAARGFLVEIDKDGSRH
jgi:hypothetical protein